MDSLGKLLLGFGLALILAGVVLLLVAHSGGRRLPGDIVIHRGNFTLYLPFGLMIVLSLLLTLLLNLFDRK